MRTFRPTVRTLGLALALAAGGCRGLDLADDESRDWPPVEETELGEMVNVHAAGPIWFGGAPEKADLDLAARRGVEVVIDAATPAERPDYDVEDLCVRLELEVVVLGVDDTGVTNDQVDEFLRCLEPAGEGEVLLFCGNGDRSAMLFAIHRAVQIGVPLEEAIYEARRAGMKPGGPEDFVRDQVDRLRPDLADSDASVRETG